MPIMGRVFSKQGQVLTRVGRISQCAGQSCTGLAGESPVVEGKLDHYVTSLAFPSVTKETKRRQ